MIFENGVPCSGNICIICGEFSGCEMICEECKEALQHCVEERKENKLNNFERIYHMFLDDKRTGFIYNNLFTVEGAVSLLKEILEESPFAMTDDFCKEMLANEKLYNEFWSWIKNQIKRSRGQEDG